MTEEVEMRVEYRVKEIKRYIVTRYEEMDSPHKMAGVSTRGEYDNPDVAWEVGYALCKAEHERLGYPPGDERIQYPRHPNEANLNPIAA